MDNLNKYLIIFLTFFASNIIMAQGPTRRVQSLDYSISRQNLENTIKSGTESIRNSWDYIENADVYSFIADDSATTLFYDDSLFFRVLGQDRIDVIRSAGRENGDILTLDDLGIDRTIKPAYVIPVVVHVIHTNEHAIPEEFEEITECYNPNLEYRTIEETIFNMNQILSSPADNPLRNTNVSFNELNNPTGIDYTNKPFENFGNPEHHGIILRLATTDPNGNPTSGVVRHNLDQEPYKNNIQLDATVYETYGVNYIFEENEDNDRGISEEALKNATAWDPSRYLNIWLVNYINYSPETGNSSTHGYSYFPGEDLGNFDGIVIDSRRFTPTGCGSYSEKSNEFQNTPRYNLPELMELFGRYMGLYPTYKDVGMDILTCEATSNGLEQLDYNLCSSTGDYVCDTYPQPRASSMERLYAKNKRLPVGIERTDLDNTYSSFNQGTFLSGIQDGLFQTTTSKDLDTLFIEVSRRPIDAGGSGGGMWGGGAFSFGSISENGSFATHGLYFNGAYFSNFGGALYNNIPFVWPYAAECKVNIQQPDLTFGWNADGSGTIHPDVTDLDKLHFYFFDGSGNIIDDPNINPEGGYVEGTYTIKIDLDLYSKSDWEHEIVFRPIIPGEDPDNYSVANGTHPIILSTILEGIRLGNNIADPVTEKAWDIDGDGEYDLGYFDGPLDIERPPVPDVGSTRFNSPDAYWGTSYGNDMIWNTPAFFDSPCLDFYSGQINFTGYYNKLNNGSMTGLAAGSIRNNYMNDAPYKYRNHFTIGQTNRMAHVLELIRPNLAIKKLPPTFINVAPDPCEYPTVCYQPALGYAGSGDSLASYMARQLPRLPISDLELTSTLKRVGYTEYMPVFHIRNTGGDPVDITKLRLTITDPSGNTSFKEEIMDHIFDVSNLNDTGLDSDAFESLGGGKLFTEQCKYNSYKIDPGFTYRFTPIILDEPGVYEITATIFSDSDTYASNNEHTFTYTKQQDGYIRFAGELSKWNRTAAIEIYDSFGNLVETTKDINHPINYSLRLKDREEYIDRGYRGFKYDFSEKNIDWNPESFTFDEISFLKPGTYTLRLSPIGYTDKGEQYLYTKEHTLNLLPLPSSIDDGYNYNLRRSTSIVDTYGRYALSDPILEGMWHADWYRQYLFEGLSPRDAEFVVDPPWEDTKKPSNYNPEGTFIRKKIGAHFTASAGNNEIYSATDTSLVYNVTSPPEFTFTIDGSFTPHYNQCEDLDLDGFCDNIDPQQILINEQQPSISSMYVGYYNANPGANTIEDSVFVVGLWHASTPIVNELFSTSRDRVQVSTDPNFNNIISDKPLRPLPISGVISSEDLFDYRYDPYVYGGNLSGAKSDILSNNRPSLFGWNVLFQRELIIKHQQPRKDLTSTKILYGIPAKDYWGLNGEEYGTDLSPNTNITPFGETQFQQWPIYGDTLYFRIKWEDITNNINYSDTEKLIPNVRNTNGLNFGRLGGAPSNNPHVIPTLTTGHGNLTPRLPLGCSNPNIDDVYHFGIHYNVKQFGDQCWMTDRLAATEFNYKNEWLTLHGHADSIITKHDIQSADGFSILMSNRKVIGPTCGDIPDPNLTGIEPEHRNAASYRAWLEYDLTNDPNSGYVFVADPEDPCYFYDPWAYDRYSGFTTNFRDTEAGLYYNNRVRKGSVLQKDYGQEGNLFENICPPGFRIPLVSDFLKLDNWVRETYGNRTKSATDFWKNEFGAFETDNNIPKNGAILPYLQGVNDYQDEPSFENYKYPSFIYSGWPYNTGTPGSPSTNSEPPFILGMQGSAAKPFYNTQQWKWYGIGDDNASYPDKSDGAEHFYVQKDEFGHAYFSVGDGEKLKPRSDNTALRDLYAYQLTCVAKTYDYSTNLLDYTNATNDIIETEGLVDVFNSMPDRGCADASACNYTAINNRVPEEYGAYGSQIVTAEEREMCIYPNECGECGAPSIQELGYCDCEGTKYDAVGECGGTCAYDYNNDGICDRIDLTSSYYNTCGLDQDGVSYNGYTYMVEPIGNQCWFKENLRTSNYRNNAPIPQVQNNSSWKGTTEGARSYYDNNSSYSTNYGQLYNWYAVNDPRGLCPSGWHVPTDEDWGILESTLGLNSDDLLRTSFRGDELSIDEMLQVGGITGFDYVPGGFRHSDSGKFKELTKSAYYWTSTDTQDPRSGRYDNAYHRIISPNRSKGISRSISTWATSESKGHGLSVRCVKD